MRGFQLLIGALSLLAGAGAASAGSFNVAILSSLGSTALDQNVLGTIAANTSFLTIHVLDVDSSTPGLAFLESNYQAVMVVGNLPFQDNVALGNTLKQYVDDGFGLVVTPLSNVDAPACNAASNHLCGGFATADYWALEPGSQRSNGGDNLGTVLVAGSPILNGVSSGAAGFNGGGGLYRVQTTANASATVVAMGTDGAPLIATRTFSQGNIEVGLNFFPVSSDGFGAGWVSSSQGGLIMANALLVAASSASDMDGSLPEPATYLSVGCGLALLALSFRRRA